MKKIILTTTVLVGGVIAVMPFVTGMIAEKASKDLVDKMNQKQVQYGYSEIINYDRGFSSTKSTYRWTMPNQPDELTEIIGDGIEYSCDAQHGITGIDYQCRLDNLESYKDFIKTHLEGQDPILLTGHVSLLGQVEQTLKVTPFDISNDDATINVGEGVLTVKINSGLNRYRVNADFEGAKVNGDGVEAVLEKITIKGDVFITKDDLQIGEMALSMSKFDLTSLGGSDAFSITNGLMSVESDEDGDTVSVDYKLGIEQVLSGNAEAKRIIDDISFAFLAGGVDRDTMIRLNDRIQAMAESSEELSVGQVTAMLPMLESLLRKGLSVSFDVGANYNAQAVNGDFSLALLEDVTLLDLSAIVYNPESVLEKLSISTHSRIPELVADLNPSLDQSLRSSPLFVSSDGAYQNSLVLKTGENSLNGQPMEFLEILQRAMQSTLQ